MPTSTYVPLGTYTLAGNASFVKFSSISQDYRDLVIVARLGDNQGNTFIRFNDDTGGNYNRVYMTGNGSTASSGSTSNTTTNYLEQNISNDTTSNSSLYILNIMDYSATDKHKTMLARVNIVNGSGAGVSALASRWASTSAITSLTWLPFGSGSILSGSTFYLFGIAG